jgi:hypothetical protein
VNGKCWVALGLLGLTLPLVIPIVMKVTPEGSRSPAPTGSLSEVLSVPAERLDSVPIGRMNLLCAQGLTTATPDTDQCLATLQTWAERVRTETARHHYRFERNPVEFEHSEAFFKLLILTVVLAEDFGVRYRAGEGRDPTSARMNDGFFARPEDVFLQGLIGAARQGTCSSLPVLYLAIGRQLGYPLKLVTTKGHLFVRWEGAGERFNIDATSRGLNRLDDDYFRHWPFDLSPDEEAAEGYLKSLTPAEELAVFLSIRGMCLREAGNIADAADAFAHAARLAPGVSSYRQMHAYLQANLVSAAQTKIVNKPITRL